VQNLEGFLVLVEVSNAPISIPSIPPTYRLLIFLEYSKLSSNFFRSLYSSSDSPGSLSSVISHRGG
jgi:hypothetical protein